MTEVNSSLAAAHEVLNLFNRISYYKVNESKSYILGLGIDTITSNRLKSQFPYTWTTEGIKYLEITLTANTNSMVEANYTPFLKKTKPETTNHN